MNDTEIYTLAEYDDDGDRLRVMSDETIQVETSPGNWHWEHHARVSEYQLAKQIHSGPSVDDFHGVALELHKAENESAEIAGKLVDAVTALESLAEIVTLELEELGGGREPEDLSHWRDALAGADGVIERAK